MSTNQENKPGLIVFNELYDSYASAFYGEIKRNLYNTDVCDQTLADAYAQIWKNYTSFDAAKERRFTWCFKIVRKEIRKRKVDLLLKEIFACQQRSTRSKQSLQS